MTDSRRAIAKLGWDDHWETLFQQHAADAWLPGRVAVEDKHHYQIFAEEGVFTGKVTGKFKARAKSLAHYPKVGDWVAFAPVAGGELVQIHAILPRHTWLSRKRKGRETSEQMLVTNLDRAFIVHGLDRELNVRLIERFMVMAREGGVRAAVLLNKTDLDTHAAERLEELRQAIGETQVLATCAKTGKGIGELNRMIQPGETVVFMGASGVGKSSLINRLYGEAIQATTEVREGDAKGRHTTTWREMIVLPSGGLVIDTPGMREFHMWMGGEGIHEAFPDIEELSLQCHFRDCSHTTEKRCAVLAAVQSGQLAEDRYQSFLKLKRELDFLHDAHQHQHRRESRRSSLLRRRRLFSTQAGDEAGTGEEDGG